MFYEVEVGNRSNGSWLFPANGGQLLRGRWDYRNVSHLSIGERHAALNQSLAEYDGKIPGMYIRIDLDKRQLSIFDPLKDTEEGAKQWRAIKEKIFANIPGSTNMEPADAIVINVPKGQDGDDQLKSWMYWSAKGIRDGDCFKTKASADWLSCEEIEETMNGERIVHPYDVSTPRPPRKERKPVAEASKR